MFPMVLLHPEFQLMKRSWILGQFSGLSDVTADASIVLFCFSCLRRHDIFFVFAFLIFASASFLGFDLGNTCVARLGRAFGCL